MPDAPGKLDADLELELRCLMAAVRRYKGPNRGARRALLVYCVRRSLTFSQGRGFTKSTRNTAWHAAGLPFPFRRRGLGRNSVPHRQIAFLARVKAKRIETHHTGIDPGGQ